MKVGDAVQQKMRASTTMYKVIIDYFNDNGWWPSLDYLSKLLNLTIRRVKVQVHSLKADGFINADIKSNITGSHSEVSGWLGKSIVSRAA
jgi:hypothetical protein